MVLFALENIYPLCTKQVVYVCNAKGCTASSVRSNDEGGSHTVGSTRWCAHIKSSLEAEMAQIFSTVKYSEPESQRNRRGAISCRNRNMLYKSIHANIHIWDGQLWAICSCIGFISDLLKIYSLSFRKEGKMMGLRRRIFKVLPCSRLPGWSEEGHLVSPRLSCPPT